MSLTNWECGSRGERMQPPDGFIFIYLFFCHFHEFPNVIFLKNAPNESAALQGNKYCCLEYFGISV